MKRYVVGTLLFSIVMFVQLFGNIPVFADTFVPTSSYDFIGLSDLGYALVGGAEFDFSGTTYVIDNYSSLSAEQQEIAKSLKAREFLKDYCEARGIAYEEDGTLYKGSAYYTTAFGLAGLDFFEAFQTASDPSNLEYKMPISPSRFADWAQYNKFWFNKYASDFVVEDTPGIEVNPDQNYYSYLDTINGTGFFFKNYSITPINNHLPAVTIDIPTMTWVKPVNYGFNTRSYPSPFITISVTGNDTQGWSLAYSGYSSTAYTLNSAGNEYIFWYTNEAGYSNQILNGYVSMSYAGNIIYPDNYFTNNVNHANTLSQALTYISTYFRNVNIVVNGEYWTYVGGDAAPADPTVPTFPDILNQTGRYDDLAYDIPMPNTDTYSGTFDLTSLFDAIREGIAGASDNDLSTGATIGVGDITRSYEGEGIDIQERVVDLTSTRVFEGTLTDHTTGRLPDIPVVPGGVQAGFGGVTVLAKFVDATQCILPDELMIAFWGIVWILLILGLIKNLHR